MLADSELETRGAVVSVSVAGRLTGLGLSVASDGQPVWLNAVPVSCLAMSKAVRALIAITNKGRRRFLRRLFFLFLSFSKESSGWDPLIIFSLRG